MQLVILGRDGVINEARPGGISEPADWQPLRGSLEAIARLHRSGWRVVVCMNQPPLPRGTLAPDLAARINETMRRRVNEAGGAIDAVFYCPHAPGAGCDCCRPEPGLLHELAGRLRHSLADVPVIVADLDDARAARAVDANPMLVRSGLESATAAATDETGDIPVFNDLYNAVESLLAPANQV